MFLRTTTRLVLAAGLLGAAPALAQQNAGAFRAPPQQQIVNQPGAQTQIANPVQQYPQFNFNSNPYMNSPGYGGWGGGYYPGAAGGYLNGVAAVTTANANSIGTVQQARITQQQANQAAYDTRRRALDEARYEQSLKPTLNEIHEHDMAQALRRARNDPPRVEVWDGSALNTLLGSIKRMQASGLRGPLVPLEPDMVRHINLSGGAYSGNVGLLKDGGKLDWPYVLKGNMYEPERKKLNEMAPQAVREAMSGSVSDDTIGGMSQAVDSLRNKIDDQVKIMPPSDYMRASRYCNELRSTVRGLQDPNVAKKLNGQWSARGNNVGEVLGNMIQQGLSFAPVTPGDETYYTSLYQSMISYDMGLSQLASRYAPSSGGQ